MDKGVHELRREYWREIVRQCNAREPGVTKLSWFEEHNINSKTFYYWQKQFRTEAVASVKETASAQGNESTSLTAPAFFDITSSVRSFQEETRINASDPSVQMTSANPPELMIQISDCRIYINSSIQEKTLETVMRVLHHA